MAADAVLVRLHGQDEGRDANGDGVDQAQLRGRIGIGEREDERGDREDEGEDVLDKIAGVDTDYSDRPRKPQVMKTVTVETFGVDYPEPEKC